MLGASPLRPIHFTGLTQLGPRDASGSILIMPSQVDSDTIGDEIFKWNVYRYIEWTYIDSIYSAEYYT